MVTGDQRLFHTQFVSPGYWSQPICSIGLESGLSNSPGWTLRDHQPS
ncbi:unnamed protein product [Schistosoma curassoni]|uniref:Uncharacterized protein n=1 Tax=Schistosoma curassoni TaxID=6186 RepID=A0A183K8U2_9TREM|nr:unnamed protein product [Schistosoma curassoni]